MPGLRDSENSIDWSMQARARLMRQRNTKPATKAGQIWDSGPKLKSHVQQGKA